MTVSPMAKVVRVPIAPGMLVRIPESASHWVESAAGATRLTLGPFGVQQLTSSGLAPRLKGVPGCWCGGRGYGTECPPRDDCPWDACVPAKRDYLVSTQQNQTNGSIVCHLSKTLPRESGPRGVPDLFDDIGLNALNVIAELASLRGRAYESSDDQGWSYMFSNTVDPISASELARRCKGAKEDATLVNASIVKFRKSATRQDGGSRTSCVVIASSIASNRSRMFARAFNLDIDINSRSCKGPTAGTGPCAARDPNASLQIRLVTNSSLCNFTLALQPWASRRTRTPGQTPSTTVGPVVANCSDVKTSALPHTIAGLTPICTYTMSWPILGWKNSSALPPPPAAVEI